MQSTLAKKNKPKLTIISFPERLNVAVTERLSLAAYLAFSTESRVVDFPELDSEGDDFEVVPEVVESCISPAPSRCLGPDSKDELSHAVEGEEDYVIVGSLS
jgi:hypothetical protein